MNINQHFTEADWKLFRKKIAGWQEAYMEKLVREYMDLLSEDGNPADKFWRQSDLSGITEESENEILLPQPIRGEIHLHRLRA